MDRYPYDKYTILLGATRALAHIGIPLHTPRFGLSRYTPDPAHVVDWGEIEVDTDGTFKEGPACIMDSRYQVLRRKTVRLVRVLWQHRGLEEST